MDDRTETLLRLLDSAGPALHALLTRLTLRTDAAEDLMQELSLRLLRARGFIAAADPAAYAYRAAMRLAFDWRRARRRRPREGLPPTDPPSNEPSPLSVLERREQFERVLDALSHVRPLQREAFVLRHIQQESFETIAARLDKTPHQVRGLCHKAMQRLRVRLGAAMDDATERCHVP